jgi:hypothetical protein
MTSLFDHLHKDGYMGMGPDKDKVILNMLVHDEGHLQVDYSIHPYKMYGYIKDYCMLDIKNYPNIYCGISICKNWFEGKMDLYEAPVEFAFEMAQAYRDNPDKFDNDDWKLDPQDYVHRDIKNWIHNYVNKFIESNTDENNIFDIVKFRNTNENYFVFVKVGMYTTKFTNTEEDLTLNELIILSHNENQNLIVKTENREIKMSDYIFNYIPENSPKPSNSNNNTSEFNNVDDLISSLDDLDDFNLDDLDLDTNFDAEYKEQESINCYWISNENENIPELVPETSNLSLTPVFETELEEEEHITFKKFFDIGGTYCLNLTGLTNNRVQVVSDYLKNHKNENGQRLMYTIGTSKKFLPYKVSGISAEDLRLIMEE